MDSITSIFHIDWKIIIAQVINFGIVIGVLYFYALKPLSKLMQERGEKIAKGLDDAKSNAEILKSTEVEYEKALSKARVEAYTIFENSKKEAENKKTEMLLKAQNDVNTMISEGKKMLENEKTKMVLEAKKEIVSLIIASTEKIIGEKTTHLFDEKTIKELNNL